MKAVYIKLFIAAVLFLAWIALVALKVPNADDLVSFIKTALEGLGLYHAVTWGNEPLPLIEGGALLPVTPTAAVAGQATAGTTPSGTLQ